MTLDSRPLPMPDVPDDALLARYREANAHDPLRPAPALRAAVLAHAQAHAHTAAAQARSQRPAANDGAWTWRALGGVAVLGLVGLLVLQFDRGSPEERNAALGPTGAAPAATAPAATPDPPTAVRKGADAHPGAVAPAEAEARAPVNPVPSPAQPVPQSRTAERERSVAPSAPAPAPERREITAPAPMAGAPVEPPSLGAIRASPPPAAAAESVAGAAPAERDADTGRPPDALAPSRAGAAPAAKATDAGTPAAQATAPAMARLREVPALTPLLAAAAQGHADAVRLAVSQGADVNGTDAAGRTALMRAAQNGHAGVVRWLLDAGADPLRTDREGLTAADLARRAGHSAVVALLDKPPPR
jgi:Ankyrin repeats (many copies)